MWAVSYAGGITRTTNVGAPSLCTSGPYGYTRNPLYIGNMIIYSGVVFVAGSLNILSMLIVTWAFFIIQYYLIINLEQNTLIDIFGEEYKNYLNNVPILFPRLSSWKNKDKYVGMGGSRRLTRLVGDAGVAREWSGSGQLPHGTPE